MTNQWITRELHTPTEMSTEGGCLGFWVSSLLWTASLRPFYELANRWLAIITADEHQSWANILPVRILKIKPLRDVDRVGFGYP